MTEIRRGFLRTVQIREKMRKLITFLALAINLSMANVGTTIGKIQTIETDAMTTGTPCSQNRYFIKINNDYYWADYNEAGKGMLSLALAAYSTKKSILLYWNDISTVCPPAYKRIDQISFVE
jgi:hypothetical protein